MVSELSKSTPVVVLGHFRTGTSLVAELIERWGAYGGSAADLRPGDARNAHGFFENQRMRRFVEDRLIGEAGTKLLDPAFPARMEALAKEPEWHEEAMELLAAMAEGGDVWYWKDPLLCLTLPFWKPLWGDAVYVVPVRNPFDSAVSWQRFSSPGGVANGGSMIAANLLRWQHYYRSVLAEIDASRRKIFVRYEELLRSPAEQCRRLAAFLDRECGAAGRRPDRVEAMAQAVAPELRKVRTETPLHEVWQATPEQRRLQELLVRKIDDPDLPFDEAAYPMYAGWREYLDNLRRFGAYHREVSSLLSSPLGRLLVATRKGTAMLRHLRGSDVDSAARGRASERPSGGRSRRGGERKGRGGRARRSPAPPPGHSPAQ